MSSIQKLLDTYNQNNNDPEGATRIQTAFDLAQSAHEGQRRRSNHPYIVHPLSVAILLAELGLGWEIICAALLHDTVEDTHVSITAIKDALGSAIAQMVESVTKIKTAALSRRRDKKDAEIESMRKIILGTTQDLRVILIKLADRWDNLKSLEHLNRDRQKAIAQETMALYTPFANRLGLTFMRIEMENLCFKYLKPRQYMKYSQRLAISKQFLKEDVKKLTSEIQELLHRENIPHDLIGRFTTPYLLYMRSTRQLQPKTLEMNILTETARDCYSVLGIIHEEFTPLPGSMIRDFIAVPRSNGYQALHTKILFRENIHSIQIRTKAMDQVARYGVLAKVDGRPVADYQTWINTLKDLASDETDSRKFIRGVKDAAEADRIYVCTPKGDYWSFPPHAIVLDFAYRIHTDIGHRCDSAFMDGQPANIYDELKNGSVVRIITSPEVHPKSEWMNRIKTPRARSAVRAWLDIQKRKWSRDFGRRMLSADLQIVNIDIEDLICRDEFREYLEQSGTMNTDEFFSKIGRGIISTREIISHFVSPKDYKKVLKKDDSRFSLFIPKFLKENKGRIYQIRDINDAYIKLSKCCNPLPGDNIVGVLSKQHGVSVHQSGCEVLRKRQLNKDQILQLKWNLKTQQKLAVRFRVKTENRPMIPMHILKTLQDRKFTCTKFHMHHSSSGYSIEIELEPVDTERANVLLRSLEKIKGIQKTQRL
jgi:GTP diphosphokinase / guanosine-3',5'-bis(diphosphate) 3'-diphosphatase